MENERDERVVLVRKRFLRIRIPIEESESPQKKRECSERKEVGDPGDVGLSEEERDHAHQEDEWLWRVASGRWLDGVKGQQRVTDERAQQEHTGSRASVRVVERSREAEHREEAQCER